MYITMWYPSVASYIAPKHCAFCFKFSTISIVLSPLGSFRIRDIPYIAKQISCTNSQTEEWDIHSYPKLCPSVQYSVL